MHNIQTTHSNIGLVILDFKVGAAHPLDSICAHLRKDLIKTFWHTRNDFHMMQGNAGR